MKIQQVDDDRNGKFYLEMKGRKLASIIYSHAGSDKIIIDHTEVDESLKGRDVGCHLEEVSDAFARANDIKILPLCSFVNAVFNKRSVYKNVKF